MRERKDGTTEGRKGAADPLPVVPSFRLSSLLVALAILPAVLHAQDTDLERSRQRLQEIRRERDRLQEQQQRLQGQVHDVNDELSNLERQRESTQRIVNEIERQIGGLASQLDRSSAELILAEDNLAERRAVLERRLVDIYKRGTLYTYQALFAAESFGDLLSRYKYLYLTSRQDRALVTDVEQLRNRVVVERNTILDVRTQLDRSRQEREAEVAKFTDLAQARARRLESLQRSARSTERRLTTLQKDEARLNGLLAALERARRDDAARGLRGAVAGPGSITTASLGKLDWPVEGTIVYRFGRDTLPSGGIIRWNGVGIAAAVGTPVHAVAAGKVRLVGQFGTYGLTIVLEHGNGYYSVYSHLQSAEVKLGADHHQGPDGRLGRRRELRLRAAPALRDPRGEPGRARSDDLAAEALAPALVRDADPLAGLRPPTPERGFDQGEQVVGHGDRRVGIRDDPGGHAVQPLADPHDPAPGAVGAGLGQHQRQLVAAVAGDEIGQAELAPDPADELLPLARLGHRIGVVGRERVLRVEQDQAEAQGIAPGALELLLQPAIERRRRREAWPAVSRTSAVQAARRRLGQASRQAELGRAESGCRLGPAHQQHAGDRVVHHHRHHHHVVRRPTRPRACPAWRGCGDS